MADNPYEIVPDDAPNRCQGVGAQGQCRFAVVEGDSGPGGILYCPMHGGNAARAFQARQDKRRYKLAIWQDRVNELADDDQLKTLNDEIGILRMTLEQVLVQCLTATDLMLWAPKIADLVSKIEKLVVTCSKMELATGVVLTKRAAFTLASAIVDIVSKHVTDPEAVAAIADEIGAAIAGIKPDAEGL